jgi:tRNA nucleotidyltransferase (CCA-adding enzyme)
MKIYAVGGSVRDQLLGLPGKDQDYVVVGATPEEMGRLGFRPVGKDFPVFLHPETQEEYALARTERKQGPGYRGFAVHAAPEVTLEEDLARRDLTINAIARDASGRIIDPFGGVADLRAGLLRHVSAAFVEDPVRILRVARFSARFGFSLAADTARLMLQMVADGEVDHLVPERVWQEISRGLMESTPSRMFEILRGCGALARIMPEIDTLFGVPQPAHYHPEIDTGVHVLRVMDFAAQSAQPLVVRFAALTHDLGKGVTPRSQWPAHHGHEALSAQLVQQLSERLRVPADCRELALLVARHHGVVHKALELRPRTILKLLEATDALRRPQRFELFLAACASDFHGRPGYEGREYPAPEILRSSLAAAAAVDAGAIARVSPPQQIPLRIARARLAAVIAARQRYFGCPGQRSDQ